MYMTSNEKVACMVYIPPVCVTFPGLAFTLRLNWGNPLLSFLADAVMSRFFLSHFLSFLSRNVDWINRCFIGTLKGNSKYNMVAHVKSSKYKLRYMYEYFTPECQIKSALEQSLHFMMKFSSQSLHWNGTDAGRAPISLWIMNHRWKLLLSRCQHS